MLIIICTPIVVIFSNLLFLVFNENVYVDIYQKTSIYNQIDKNLVNQSTKNLRGYFRGRNNLEHKYYSEQAIFHLKDVKNLLQLTQILLILSTTTLLIIISLLVGKNQFQLIKDGLILGSMATMGISFLFVIILSLNFQQSFILFHKIAFSNNLWLFDETDNLIKLFPIEFFTTFAKQLAINIIATSALVATFSFLIVKND